MPLSQWSAAYPADGAKANIPIIMASIASVRKLGRYIDGSIVH
jgi:hypothetical protein